MDINAASLAALNVAYTAAFNERLTGAPTTYGRVAMTVRSSTRHQHYPRLSELGGMREWVGERFVQRLETSGFTIENKTYENTLAIIRDDIADDQVGIYAPVVQDMGQTAAELPDDLVWAKLASGFTATHYDGQFFFDQDHPVENANGTDVSVSNFQGGGGSAWYLIDTTRMIKPMIFQDREPAEIVALQSLTDESVFKRNEFQWGARRRCAAGFGAWQLAYASKQTLDSTNYAAARAAMMAMTGHRGRKLNLRPNLLVVHPGNEAAARQILNAEMLANNTNVWRNSAELHVETRLT